MKIKIVSIDEHGFQGREFHPEPSDVGLVGHVLRYDVLDDETGLPALQSTSDFLTSAKATLAQERLMEDAMGCFLVVTPDGRKLEVMEHEAEIVA